VSRSQVEDLLYLEAELLDHWQLQDWLALYADPTRYLVPSPGLPPDANPEECLFLINDDRARLGGRVSRLGKRSAHSEYPHSKTLHLVSNIRPCEPTDGVLPVKAAFQTTRVKDGLTDVFFGRLSYLLTLEDSKLRIREKRCDLAMESLVPQGRITIIL
jgi:p-cumate 2,3-dioxygenase beta subunit